MSTYEGPDEYPIEEVPDTPLWSENFAALGVCQKANVSVFYSVGRWHSDPHLWRELIMFALPDGQIAHVRNYGRCGTRTAAGGGLTRYEIVEPGKRVRLTFDGPMMITTASNLIRRGQQAEPSVRCMADLDMRSCAPMWNMKSDSEQAQTMAGSMHIDQLCQMSGTVRIGNDSFKLDNAFLVRDHSRGVRDLSLYAGHNWLNGILPSGRAFYTYMMKSADGGIGMSYAAVCEGHRIYPARVLSTEFRTGPDHLGKAHLLVLDSERGRMEIEFTRALASFPIGLMNPYDTCAGSPTTYDTGMTIDEPMVIRCNGEVGLGWSERGFSGARRQTPA